jgi:hypothetical protein
MPGRAFHGVEYLIEVFPWYSFMEKIAHGVHENLARARPAERLIETLWSQCEVEARNERMASYSPEALR